MIVDLDDLITKPVGFTFKGKLYRVEPVSAEKFMELSKALSEVGALLADAQAGNELAEKQVYDVYQKFVQVLVPSFTADILKEMQIAQVHAMINLIIKHATGQPLVMEELTEKKKMNLKLPH